MSGGPYAAFKAAGWRLVVTGVWRHKKHGTLIRQSQSPHLWVHMPRRGWVGGVYDRMEDAVSALQTPKREG